MSINIERVSGQWNLTQIESEVVRMLVAGSPNSAIARALSRSVKTVEAHITKILKKAECQNRVELIVKGMSFSGHASGTLDLRGVVFPDTQEVEQPRLMQMA